jgi:hypothetical protein
MGLVTANRLKERVVKKMDVLIEDRSVVHRVNNLVQQWLSMRLGTISACISFFCTVLQVTSNGFISPQNLALAITYAQV